MFDGGHGLVGVFVFDDDGVFDVGLLVADPWLGDDEVGLVVVSASMRRSRSSFGRSWKVRLSCPVSWHIALRRWELGVPSHLALNPGMGAMRGVMVWQSWFAK